MNKKWSLQDAKAHFSELVKSAQKYGPQYVSVRGDVTVVVISQKEYLTLTKPRVSLVEFFRQSPLAGLDLDFSRDESPNPEVNL